MCVFGLVFSLSLFVLLRTASANVYLLEWDLFWLSSKPNSFLLIVDVIRLTFIMTVLVIRSRVYRFRRYYIEREKHFRRFHLILFVFILRMAFLILSPNLIRLLLGWDGLGLRSFLLVVYYRRKKSFGAGFITALSNRVGDAFILISIALLAQTSRLNLREIRNLNWDFYSYQVILLVLAFFTKRAQIPFRAWLPAAIAAPTPVSALVHSSTLVTAGVYVLIRFNSLSEMWVWASKAILVVGSLTMFMARLRAFFERDIKKIVALSTLSQLGVIIVRIGIQEHYLRFFHLLAHAFFKALLFIASGVFIHNSNNYQDLRFMGRKTLSLPLSSSMALISSGRLCGLPFISAFYSKESVLELLIVSEQFYIMYIIFLLGVGMTLFYRIRFVYFRLSLYSSHLPVSTYTENRNYLIISYVILSPLAVGGGRLIAWLFSINSKTIIRLRLAKIRPLVVLFVFALLFIKYLDFVVLFITKSWVWGNLWSLHYLATQALILTFRKSGTLVRRFDQTWNAKGLTRFRFINLRKAANLIPSQFFISLTFILLTLLFLIWVYLCNLT